MGVHGLDVRHTSVFLAMKNGITIYFDSRAIFNLHSRLVLGGETLLVSCPTMFPAAGE